MSAQLLGPGDLNLRDQSRRDRERSAFDRVCNDVNREIFADPSRLADMQRRFCESSLDMSHWFATAHTGESLFGRWLEERIERDVRRQMQATP